MTTTPGATAEMDAHRRRYEALKAAGVGKAPLALPPATGLDEAPIAPETVIARETIPGGWYTTLSLRRGETLRIVNTMGTSAVSLIAWNAADTSERLNHADTVKIQWSANLRKGRVIFSDMGRVILSVTEDTSAAHDALMGGSTSASTLAKYGPGPYRNTRDNFVAAALKIGLSRRDIAPCVTFFSPVAVAEDGTFVWLKDVAKAGDFVDLRAEMDLLVALSNAPHPLDPATGYDPGPADVLRYRGMPARADDLCRTATPEAARGFENTDAYLAR